MTLGFAVKLSTVPVCFSSKDNKYGTFNITIPGQISSFRLVHVSGGISGGSSSVGNWNGGTGKRFGLLITDSGNKIISPPVSMLDAYYGYILTTAVSAKDDSEAVLPPIEPTFNVTEAQEMRVWYGEDLKNSTEEDNHGTTCAHVYANYKSF